VLELRARLGPVLAQEQPKKPCRQALVPVNVIKQEFPAVHKPQHEQQIDLKKPNEDRSLGAHGK
jgi:hypothetical protein